MNQLFRIKLLIPVALAFLIAGCGGGGGGSSSNPPPPSNGTSDWDSMVWDQGTWG